MFKYLIILILFSHCYVLSKDSLWLNYQYPEGGNVLDIEVSKNNYIFLGCYSGLYKSSNDVISWANLIRNEICPDIHYHNNWLYCRRIKMNYLSGNYEYNFFRSFDFGNTWEKIKGNWKEDLIPSSITSWLDKVYFILNDNGIKHIYVSNDDGDSFTFITTITPNEQIRSIGRFQIFENNIYLQGWDINYHSVYFRSSNQGKDWIKIQLGEHQMTKILFISESKFYMGTEDGIYLTIDTGKTWNNKWLKNNQINNLFIFNHEEIIIASILKNSNFYYILSTNNGENWIDISGFNDLNILGKSNIDIMKQDSSGNYYCNPYYYGVYKSSDNGVSWSSSNKNLSSLSPSEFLFKDSTVYLSCWGIFKSIDKGQNFNYLDLKSYDTGPIAMNSKGDIFVGDQSSGGTEKGIFRSTDGGQSWESLYNNEGPRAIVINKRDVLFIGSFSTDNGNSWHAPPSFIDAIGTNDYGDLFTFSWENPGNDNSGIWRSTDDGVTWNKIPTETFGFIDPTITNRGGSVVFNNFTKSAWFGPLANIDNSFRGIYKTTDNGRTWFSINLKAKGYDWYPTGSKVAVDSLGCWVASRDGEKYGIYRSCDNGVTWIREDTTGLPKEFGPIGVSPDGHIYVFGATGGLYRSTKKYVSVEHRIRENIYNMIVSPNPAQEKIKVELPPYFYDINFIDYLGELNDDIIEIYDVLGNRVIIEKPDLLDAIENQKDIEVDISGIPPGVYFLRYGKLSQKFVKL